MRMAMHNRSDKYTLSEVNPDGSVIWTTKISSVESVLIPVSFRGYTVESIILAGMVRLKIIGRHKENSLETIVRLDYLQGTQGNHALSINDILFRLADEIAEEDILFDAFTGKR